VVKKDSVLEDTLLEKALVGTIDGDAAIFREVEKAGHIHYFNIINGEYITDCKDCEKTYIRIVEEITIEGSIYTYLTEEELLKALNSELTEEDIVAIIKRVQNSLEEEKSLVKK